MNFFSFFSILISSTFGFDCYQGNFTDKPPGQCQDGQNFCYGFVGIVNNPGGFPVYGCASPTQACISCKDNEVINNASFTCNLRSISGTFCCCSGDKCNQNFDTCQAFVKNNTNGNPGKSPGASSTVIISQVLLFLSFIVMIVERKKLN
uniref:Uncharacterized protein n=1 Tax=Acrobeloides nanus TaxID=290746 RepID=A0A914C3M5_9BILA